MRKEVLLKASEERGIRNLGEATEIPQFFGEGKKKDKQGIRGNGKDFLKDQSRKKAGESSMKRFWQSEKVSFKVI